jgi:predicted phosphodiesterase
LEAVTMRIAVISDTHGNLLALDAVLAELDAEPVDEIVMAGDFVFGGPFPAECIERVRERNLRAVRGNTDEFIVEVATAGARPAREVEPGQRHGPLQIEIDRWAVEQLTGDQIDYLAALPLQITIPDRQSGPLAIVHATPWSSHPPVGADAPEAVARRMLDISGGRALGYGHIHVQYQWRIDGRLLAAVGSVGLPFDGDQRAAYAIFTSTADGWDVEFRRVPYDVEATIEQVLSRGVPNAAGFAATLRSASPPRPAE